MLKTFLEFSLAKRPSDYASRYINDFNATSPLEPIYDYDNTRTEIDKVPFHESPTKNNDENLEIIYPNPDDIRRMHHEESVIKICML